MLEYHRSDELPQWVATISYNGSLPDFSSGWTFRVVIAEDTESAAVLTKTTGITGATGGVITVAWASAELDIAPGEYVIQLKATRTSDSAEATVADVITIKARL